MKRLGVVSSVLVTGATALVVLAGCSSSASTTALPSVVPSTSVAPSVSHSPAPGRSSDPAPSSIPLSNAALGAQAPAPAVVPPVRLVVDGQGVDVAVTPMGPDATGAMGLPGDPHVAGWYRFGPTSGSPSGTTVLAAHVDQVGYGIGPFASLSDTPVGTTIDVTNADGVVAPYRVASVQLQLKTGVPWASIFDPTGPPRLVLVTCGGAFNYTTGHYLSNLIITADPA